MPRRQFVADLGKAVAGVSISGVSHVEQGEDDGQFMVTCAIPGGQIRLNVWISEVSEYPSGHTCMLFAADDAPSRVALSLDSIAKGASRKTVQQILEHISECLQSGDEDGSVEMMDSQEYDGVQEDSDEDVDDFFPDDGAIPQALDAFSSSMTGSGSAKSISAFRRRIRSDLLAAKYSGFKVGCLGGLMDGFACYVSISCRISKLGISEEAMEAWDLKPSDYLVLIIAYPNGYKPMESVRAYDASNVGNHFALRIGICSTYKPTLQEAIRAFTDLNKEAFTDLNKESGDQQEKEAPREAGNSAPASPRGFRDSFISRSLNGLFKDRFALLLKYRDNGMSWHGAELFYHDNLGHKNHSELALADRYMATDTANAKFPSLVTSDHISEAAVGQPLSLPLISMQFALRHFVRCTEFCLVCFSKMPNDLQAIKPYVCDNSLCLWQYMSLGFGPSIEHEILSQPKVVDLLISFCYNSASSKKLSHFPNGLSLMVPPSSPPRKTCGYNPMTKEIIFQDKNVPCPIHTGEWLVLRVNDNVDQALHCRVTNTSFYPTISVTQPIVVPSLFQHATGKPQPPSHADSYKPPDEFQRSTLLKYDQNFDILGTAEKQEAIVALLDLLPSVGEMRDYLQRRAQSTLSTWIDRLPPAVLGVLRWIIASNRACIMQVAEEEDAGSTKDRIFGVPGWTQFRFAMGAPDKERRFRDAVRCTSQRLHLNYPTLFAWHGSPLQNWHSIIREGLHFRDTTHGRAYGHGVYHSLDYRTSMGYSTHYHSVGSHWQKSDLMVHQAVALNEIVNAPNEFVSNQPHLVVAQLDWIQTRYLFVQAGNAHTTISTTKERRPIDPIDQDPSYTPNGPGGKLIIPKSAIGGSLRSKSHSVTSLITNKRQKTGSSVFDAIEIDDEDDLSVATLQEDRDIFDGEDAEFRQLVADSVGLATPNSDKGKATIKTGFFSLFNKGKAKASSDTLPNQSTGFQPGTLDFSTLPRLAQPVWATSAATKRLMADLKDLLKIQAKQPLHELGWYIDEDNITNMYQWVVELHSFDPNLPLAQDMKRMGHNSIVLELRFGREYPFAPPFVRVIRPRFLSFQQGGGGHVTAGGAMCMELLTNTGWSSILSLEALLLSVRLEMSSTTPRPARLVSGNYDYGVGEAVEAYIRACHQHGWAIPPGFREMAAGGQPPS